MIRNVLWFAVPLMRDMAMVTLVNNMLNPSSSLFNSMRSMNHGFNYSSNNRFGISQHIDEINKEADDVLKILTEEEK